MTKQIAEALEALKKISGKTNAVELYKFIEKLSMEARKESQKEVNARSKI